MKLKFKIMEIKANELRIGNYIHHKEHGFVRVYGMNNEIIQFNHGGLPYYEKRPFDLFSYISITEDILFNCGFEKNQNYEQPSFEEPSFEEYHLLEDTDFSIGDFNDEYWVIDFLDKAYGSPEIKYLHQLQNLYFALTNQELEINL